MTNDALWSAVEDWFNENRGTVCKIHYKYGWLSDKDYDDTLQDVKLYGFTTLKELHNDGYDIESTEAKRLLKNRIIGRYHQNVWRHRNVNRLRKSDIYINVPKDADESVTCHEISDIEAWGHYNNDYIPATDDSFDVADEYTARELASNIVQTLFLLLSEKQTVIMEDILGMHDCGVSTHKDLIDKTSLTRSGVTKAVKSSKNIMMKFCRKHGLTADMPRAELYEKVLEAVRDDIVKKNAGEC